MEYDSMLAVAQCFAEIMTADISDKVRSLRFSAVQELRVYLRHYSNLGYMPKLIYAIAEKKCRLINTISSKAEMERLIKPRCPHYNGNTFIPDEYGISEEEAICWSEASLLAPLNSAAFQRYMEVFQMVLPEESEKMKLAPIHLDHL